MSTDREDAEMRIELLRARWVGLHREYREAKTAEERIAVRDRLYKRFDAECRDIIARELGFDN